MKEVVVLLGTVCCVLGLMVPPAPVTEPLTFQVLMGAEQVAFVPPFVPAQFQVQGPEPLTALALPAVQRLVVGALVAGVLLAEPHAPSTGSGVKVTLTEQSAVMAFVV